MIAIISLCLIKPLLTATWVLSTMAISDLVNQNALPKQIFVDTTVLVVFIAIELCDPRKHSSQNVVSINEEGTATVIDMFKVKKSYFSF